MAARAPAAEWSNAEWLVAVAPGSGEQPAAIADLRHGLLGSRSMRPREFAEQAEDFAKETKETMVKILASLDSFRDESRRCTTWAHKIAIRVARTELCRKCWNDVSLDTLLNSTDGNSIPRALADPEVGPERAAQRHAVLNLVLRYIREDLADKDARP